MDLRPSHPQAGDANAQAEASPQPPLARNVNIAPAPGPPALPDASLESSLGPPPPRRILQGKKQVASSSKVAIPRQRTGAVPRYNRRVPLACETCRQRKTKCSGDTPVCRQCAELRVECRYPVSWRERTKGQLSKLSNKSDDYEQLLREICYLVDGRTAERIKNTLDKYTEAGDGGLSESQSNSNSTPLHDEEPDPDAPSSPSSIGSLDAIDRVDEDLNRTAMSRATGYMGKNSEITWMQRLRREAEQRARKLSGQSDSNPDLEFALHSVSYHLDDMDISAPGPVQLYWMPPRNVADKLFGDYLETIHPSFPIISRTLFSAQYRNFFDNSARPNDKWLAILNLIFAVASYHAHLTRAPWRGGDTDHLIYLTRARALSMNSDTLFTHPDLQQVQVEALTAFYLLAIDQINRAWRIASLALRSGISLGLNLRNSSAATPGVSKEARYRVWWCLYTFEHLLGVMTGRATGISDGVCTTPMPLPLDEDRFQDPVAVELLKSPEVHQERVEAALASSFVRQMPLNPQNGRDLRSTDKVRDAAWLKSLPPSNSLFFLYYVDLAVIVQEIVNRVYSVDCAMTPWAHIENRMGELRSRIELWYSNLPEAYDFAKSDEQSVDMLRERLFLALLFYSARITLGRPCLCRRDSRPGTVPYQKPAFSHEISLLVLDSARQLLCLIPDVPDSSRIYQICPWWCILHYLMQATTVLLLELSFGSFHMPEEEKNILEVAKKGIRWLYAMSEFSLASRRAWELCDGNFRRLAVGLNYDVSDIPAPDYRSDPDVTLNHPPPPPPPTVSATQALRPTSSTQTFHAPPQDQQHNQHQPTPSHDHTLHQSHSESAPLFPPDRPDFPFTMDPLLPSTVDASSDIYFPYDPITGEFIRSFFPTSAEEEQPWGDRDQA